MGGGSASSNQNNSALTALVPYHGILLQREVEEELNENDESMSNGHKTLPKLGPLLGGTSRSNLCRWFVSCCGCRASGGGTGRSTTDDRHDGAWLQS